MSKATPVGMPAAFFQKLFRRRIHFNAAVPPDPFRSQNFLPAVDRALPDLRFRRQRTTGWNFRAWWISLRDSARIWASVTFVTATVEPSKVVNSTMKLL